MADPITVVRDEGCRDEPVHLCSDTRVLPWGAGAVPGHEAHRCQANQGDCRSPAARTTVGRWAVHGCIQQLLVGGESRQPSPQPPRLFSDPAGNRSSGDYYGEHTCAKGERA